LSAVDSATWSIQMLRAPLSAGCLVTGFVTAYLAMIAGDALGEMPPLPSVNLNGVPGLAGYRPIWE
jgi:hypothetical protein